MLNKRLGMLAILSCVLPACFSMIRDPQRRFYVLNVPGQAIDETPVHVSALQQEAKVQNDALIRVRDLDCESAYDKFQMVVRRSPFELTYRNKDVWAVKPGRMISDLFARGLQQKNIFAGVTRELGERRPDWLLSGDLHVIEIEQLTNDWRAHVSMTLQISNVDSGDITWSAHFDERELVPGHDYAQAAEAMSRALARAMARAVDSIANETLTTTATPPDGPTPQAPANASREMPVGETAVPSRKTAR